MAAKYPIAIIAGETEQGWAAKAVPLWKLLEGKGSFLQSREHMLEALVLAQGKIASWGLEIDPEDCDAWAANVGGRQTFVVRMPRLGMGFGEACKAMDGLGEAVWAKAGPAGGLGQAELEAWAAQNALWLDTLDKAGALWMQMEAGRGKQAAENAGARCAGMGGAPVLLLTSFTPILSPGRPAALSLQEGMKLSDWGAACSCMVDLRELVPGWDASKAQSREGIRELAAFASQRLREGLEKMDLQEGGLTFFGDKEAFGKRLWAKSAGGRLALSMASGTMAVRASGMREGAEAAWEAGFGRLAEALGCKAVRLACDFGDFERADEQTAGMAFKEALESAQAPADNPFAPSAALAKKALGEWDAGPGPAALRGPKNG